MTAPLSIRMSLLWRWLTRQPKPYFAYLSQEQMRDVWRRHKRSKGFWDNLEIKVVHTNDFYQTFIQFPSGQYFELKGVPAEVVKQYEILGETAYQKH